MIPTTPSTHTFLKKYCVTKYSSSQKQPPEVFCEKDVLKNRENFTLKKLCYNLFLTRFMIMVSFDTPWKNKKSSGFRMFWRVIKRDQWREMG